MKTSNKIKKVPTSIKGCFIPSSYFFMMCRLLKETMLFKNDDRIFALLLWTILPLIPVIIFGWYLADLLFTSGKKQQD